MWCTRWFLPLLLLPLPTAPPYFLLLFLVSLTIHAKPCFYCIILLTTLFISSCYWQPFPIDTPLSIPWADNITTFADALNATIASNYTKPLPTVMRAVDRCWCDFAAGGLFEPYNVSHWEYLSVRRLGQNLEREQVAEDARLQKEREARKHTETPTFFINEEEEEEEHELVPTESPTAAPGFWSRLKHIADRTAVTEPPSTEIPPTPDQPLPSATEPSLQVTTKINGPPQVSSIPPVRDSLIRQEYDLRPYGLGMIVDLRWTQAIPMPGIGADIAQRQAMSEWLPLGSHSPLMQIDIITQPVEGGRW